MTEINNIDDRRFTFNGIEYYKNFISKVVGDKIEILNVYDSKIRLTDFPTLYSDIEVDGTVYASSETLQSALLPVLYNKEINVVQQLTYQTLADFNAVSPVPADGTPFIIANDPNEANNGQWSVQGGVAVQNARPVENVVEKTNTSKGVTGKAVVTELEPYINNSKYLTNIDDAKDFYTVFNGVDAEINLDTPITLSDEGDYIEFEFYVEDFGTNAGNSLSLGVIGELGIATSVIGFSSGKKLYIRDKTSNWLTLDGINVVAELNTPYVIRLDWGVSDISVSLNGVFQKTITKGDLDISNIGHSYNYFKGGFSCLKIHNSILDLDVDNITLLSNADFLNTAILRKPNTVLKIGENFVGDNNTDAVSAKQVLENTIGKDYLVISSNLIQKELFALGKYNLTGGFSTESIHWLAVKDLEVQPSTEYTLSGFGAIPGNARLCFFNVNGIFISSIDQTSTADLTFTTPSNCRILGITVVNALNIGLTPTENQYVDSLMLNVGDTALPFEPYYKLIDGNKVKNDDDTESVKSYYEFNLTANSGQPQFTVYVPIGGDRYIGYKLALQYDMSDAVYSDIWRIYNAKLYRLINGTMVSQSLNIITDGESEFVYKTNGTSDHTGGVHGDETLIDVGFYADGYELSIASDIPLTKCESFYYIQNSNLHTTDDLTHTIESEHYKKTTFSNRGYTTRNRIKTLKDITFTYIYHGLSCIAKTCANKGHNELNMKADFTGTTSNFLTSKAREFNAYNVSNSLSVFVTSELKNPIISDYDCEMFVWDRATDSKYYRKYVPSGVTPTGTLIECEMEVKFDYK